MSEKIFFRTWIKRFNDLPRAIGDLARDIELDHLNFPKSNTRSVIFTYLNLEARASPDAIRTFEEAWDEYKLYLAEKVD